MKALTMSSTCFLIHCITVHVHVLHVYCRSLSPTPEYIWYHVDVDVDPALPFDHQTIKGHALDTIEHTLVLTNPFDSPTTLNVSKVHVQYMYMYCTGLIITKIENVKYLREQIIITT